MSAGSKMSVSFIQAATSSHTCTDSPLFSYSWANNGVMFDTNEISVTLNALDSTFDIYAKETASGQTTLSMQVSSVLPN